MLCNDQNAHFASRPLECVCVACVAVHKARQAVAVVPVDHIAERNAADMIIDASRLLVDAHACLHRAHNPLMYEPSPPSATVIDGHSSASLCAVPNKDNIDEPTQRSHTRQVTNPWETSETNYVSLSEARNWKLSFEETVRDKAAELGILQDHAVENAPTVRATNIHKTTTTIKEKSKFIVCDHCRSHGIRCNEASICKECILRQIPCTHRQCDVSPQSREDCPRTVCFYVHDDFMPDISGQHSPLDKHWIILPGKLRDHLSAGQLSKRIVRSREEVQTCYESASARQQDAYVQMASFVEAGSATWDTIAMKCNCVETERDEDRTLATEQSLRRLPLA